MQARTIAAGDYVSTLSVTKGSATATYAVSGITVYSGGIDFNDGSTTTFFSGSGQSVSLALTAETRDGYQFKQYAASQGSLSGQTTDTPTLTMPGATGETLYTSYSVTAGSGGNSGRDQSMLLDNDKSTKWIGTFTPGVYAEFNTPNAIVPTGYVLTTANDASSEYWRNRSPKTWKLYGKLNEGDSWTVLDDVADGNLPNEDTTDKSYSIANTAAYKYFRYEITAIKGSTELFQLAELQLKGYDAVVISAEYDPTYNADFASGNDNDGWNIDPEQQIAGGTVTVSYTGENKVKSVTVTNKYAIAHSLAESVVGDIVGTDGLAYSVAEKGKLPVGVTAAGVVTYKSGENGIVVALQNLATKYSWSDAFTAAAAYTPAVSGQTWKLGTKDELTNALTNDYAAKYGYITAAGGTFPYPNNYWSATEVEGYTTERAWRIWLNDSNVPAWHDWDGVDKNFLCQVRPIIAFCPKGALTGKFSVSSTQPAVRGHVAVRRQPVRHLRREPVRRPPRPVRLGHEDEPKQHIDDERRLLVGRVGREHHHQRLHGLAHADEGRVGLPVHRPRERLDTPHFRYRQQREGPHPDARRMDGQRRDADHHHGELHDERPQHLAVGYAGEAGLRVPARRRWSRWHRCCQCRFHRRLLVV